MGRQDSITRILPGLHCPAAREWTEPNLHASQLVYPVFVSQSDDDIEVKGFEPNRQWGRGPDGLFNGLVDHLKTLSEKGLRSVMIFGVVDHKNSFATAADNESNPVIAALSRIKTVLPDIMCLADVCLCGYTDHGHCGIMQNEDAQDPMISNSSTLERLADIAVAYARAGADWVCPSDMMDGRVAALRSALCKEGFSHVGIMSYTSKKASTMYAAFRDCVKSNFKGDRKRYQHPPGSSLHARQALRRDEEEGASVVLVKPALFYGDLINEFARTSVLPVACYVVSGEFVMLNDYAKRTGDLESILLESHVGLLRAGASIIVTYFTPMLLDLIPKVEVIHIKAPGINNHERKPKTAFSISFRFAFKIYIIS